MQIHEITIKKKNTQLDEGVFDAVGGAVGKTISGVKNVGSAIASPFKDIAQGYQTGRMDQTISMLADKMNRGWQKYSVQWAKSQGGQYAAPGKRAPAGTQAAGGTQAGNGTDTTPPAQTKTKTSTTNAPAVDIQQLKSTIQSLDNKKLNAVAAVLSQRVGPEATMNALKNSEMTESQLNELGWQDIKTGAQKFGAGVKSAYQTAKPYVKQAAKTGMKAIKAAPGAIASGAAATAGSIAGMPGAASTAYRDAKSRVAGPSMTVQEIQMALSRLTKTQAKQLFAFVQQIQAARKAGLKEGVTPATLLPGYEQALKAFVQKNLLSGMQYSRLQNAQQFDDLVKKLVDPANDSASAQKDLWNKITLAASVAQHNPAGGRQAGDAAAAGGQKQASGDGETAEELRDTIAQNLGKDLQATQSAGALIRQLHTGNDDSIRSTGVPAVDALLLNMGFRPA
jgi:hypothetical protein